MRGNMALRVSAGYAVIAGLYILASDLLLFIGDPQRELTLATVLSIAKGLGFVAVTSVALAALLHRLETAESARYRDVLDRSITVMLLLDAKTGRIVEANAAAESFYGWPRSQLLGMSTADLSTRSPETFQDALARAARGDRLFHDVHRLAGGRTREVDVNASPIVYEGAPVIFAMVHDRTEARQAARALAESEQQLRTVLAALPDGVLLTQADRVVLANPLAIRLLRAGGETGIVGRSIYDLFVSEDHPRVREMLALLERGPGIAAPAAMERMRALDGTSVRAGVRAASYAHGGALRTVITARPLDERPPAA